MKTKNWTFPLAVSTLLLVTLACNATLPQTEPTASPAPTVAQPQPTLTSPTQSSDSNTVPLSEAGVPRIEVADAKAAFDSGKAVIVDVRSAEYFADGHAAGAINIPLGVFETDITQVPLKKDQWIITYCT
jgi:hypothetical protein